MKCALPTFNPQTQPRLGTARGLMATAQVDLKGWDTIKPMVAPFVWSYYDQHKDDKVTKLFGFYTVTVGSFGIAEMLLTAIFGPRPA